MQGAADCTQVAQRLDGSHAAPSHTYEPDHLSLALLGPRQVQRVLEHSTDAPVHLRRPEDDAVGCPELITETLDCLDVTFLPLEAPVGEVVGREVEDFDLRALFFSACQGI